MSIKESFHVTFDKSNPKSVEVRVSDCVGILKNILLEDQDKDEV